MSVLNVVNAYEKTNSFGEFLKAELSKRKWDLKDLAKAMDRPLGGWIYKMMNGQSVPRDATLEVIGEVLQIDVEILREKRGPGPAVGRKPGKVTSTVPAVARSRVEVLSTPAPQFMLELDGDRMRVSLSARVSFDTASKIVELLRKEQILP